MFNLLSATSASVSESLIKIARFQRLAITNRLIERLKQIKSSYKVVPNILKHALQLTFY